MAIAWYVAQGNSREEALRIVRAKRKVVSTVRAIDDLSTSYFVNRDERTLTGCTDPARIDGGRRSQSASSRFGRKPPHLR